MRLHSAGREPAQYDIDFSDLRTICATAGALGRAKLMVGAGDLKRNDRDG